jgi:hypothetical protein
MTHIKTFKIAYQGISSSQTKLIKARDIGSAIRRAYINPSSITKVEVV